MIEYRNLRWQTQDHTQLYAELKHPDYGWLPYCCMEGDTGIGAEIWAARAYLEIAPWVDMRDLEQTRAAKIDEINTSKNYQLNTGGLEYEEDLFAYDDNQPWISKANRVHPLSYDQLIELARLLRQEVQRIVFYGTYLEKLAQAAQTLEELDAIVWDYGAASASGIIDRLIAGGN